MIALYLNARRVPFTPQRFVRAANDTPAILSPSSIAGTGAASDLIAHAAPTLVFDNPFHGGNNGHSR